jgi:hypothetical protein
VTRPRRPWRRRGGRVSGWRERFRAALLERAEFGERHLFGIRHAAEACEFRRQLHVLGDEALDFAIEEETDLAQRVDITLLRQIDHSLRI